MLENTLLMILLNNYFDTKRELELDLRHSAFIA